jgi:hypothetical protein
LYKVRCEFASRRDAYAYTKDLEQYAEIPPCETAFRKLPYDAKKMKGTCEGYLSDALKAYPAKTVSLAVDYLAFSSPSIGEPLLFQLLQKGSARVRERVLRHLVEARAETSTDALLKLYNDARMSDWAKTKMIHKLRLLSCDTEEEPQLARNALEALKQIGDEWALKQPETKEPVVIEPSVKKSDTAAPARPETVQKEQVKQAGTSWLLLGFVAAGVVALGAAVIYLLRRRRLQSGTRR